MVRAMGASAAFPGDRRQVGGTRAAGPVLARARPSLRRARRRREPPSAGRRHHDAVVGDGLRQRCAVIVVQGGVDAPAAVGRPGRRPRAPVRLACHREPRGEAVVAMVDALRRSRSAGRCPKARCPVTDHEVGHDGSIYADQVPRGCHERRTVRRGLRLVRCRDALPGRPNRTAGGPGVQGAGSGSAGWRAGLRRVPGQLRCSGACRMRRMPSAPPVRPWPSHPARPATGGGACGASATPTGRPVSSRATTRTAGTR